jgi:membrane protease YdiL (CAAX protease family)
MAGFELYAGRLARHRRTWTAAIILLGVVIITLSQILPLIPWLMQALPLIAAHKSPPMPVIDGMFLVEETGVTILLILAWVYLFERRGAQTLGFNHHGVRRFVRGYLIGCGFLVAVVGGLWAAGVYTFVSPGVWLAPSLPAIGAILGYMAAFIIQGSSEELFMRGWLMGTVSSRHGLLFAIIFNSILFGAMHLFNPAPTTVKLAGVANVTLFGVFISLYAARERSLWGACAFHAAWNWLLGIGFGLEVSGLVLKVPPLIAKLKDTPGIPWYLSGGAWGPEASILTTVVLLAGIGFLLWRGALMPGTSYETPENPMPVVNFVRK